MSKSPCPITREQFWNHAQPLTVEVNQIPMNAEPKEFSTGSLGWHLNGKTTVRIGESAVTVQIGMNVTVIGSKNANRARTGSRKNEKAELASSAAS
jgi:hypothetical protein